MKTGYIPGLRCVTRRHRPRSSVSAAVKGVPRLNEERKLFRLLKASPCENTALKPCSVFISIRLADCAKCWSVSDFFHDYLMATSTHDPVTPSWILYVCEEMPGLTMLGLNDGPGEGTVLQDGLYKSTECWLWDGRSFRSLQTLSILANLMLKLTTIFNFTAQSQI